MIHHRLGLCLFLLIAAPSFAQDEEDELPSGLLATYSTKTHTVQRVDPTIAFVWETAAPDERLGNSEPFTAKWSGQILLRGEGRTRWHAFVLGKVEVRVEDKVVVSGETEQPAWLSGDEFDFGFGEKPLTVTFTKTQAAAQLKLFWSSSDFPLEPLPYHILFHEPPAPEIGLAARGRVLFEAHRCANCHGETRVESRETRASNTGPTPTLHSPLSNLHAPSLKHVGQGTSREWLVEKLANPTPPIESKMPHFGFTKEEAEAVVVALIEQARPVKLDPPPKLKDSERDKDLKEGRTLIRSVGCLACHTHDKLGEATPFGGGSLTDIGQHRSADWLATWLAKPTQLNEHARMPVVSLSDKERAQIVLALLVPSPPSSGERARVRGPDGDDASPSKATEERTPHPNPLPSKARGEGTGKEPLTLTLSPQSRGEGTGKVDAAQVELGRKLIESARCSACHELARPLAARPRSLARDDLDWTKSCVQTTNAQPGQPKFPQVDEQAIRAYVDTWGGHDPAASLSRAVDHQPSTINRSRLLEQKNCLACHDRDESKGLSRLAASIAKTDESLAGLHMTLIPPRLNAVGDRLHDTALAEAIQGGPKNPRLSWLRVRMPRYQHTEAEKSALMAYLIGHDRVPERVDGRGLKVDGQTHATNSNAPADPQPSTVNPRPASDPQRLLAGRELLGGKGFSCVACHAVKDYTPKVTALGTRGSNLHLLGQRMRPSYYYRWTRAPLRIMPGFEMPNYRRPHEFILPGQLDQQLTAIWEALNDPNLTSPTNPAVVEQLLTVNKGERPRIVRDVFTVAGTVDDTVARAFAIGFDNGHSVLFDLDAGCVRAWTLGDFARQRCEGKRWYWDLAGVVLGSHFDKRPDILFVNSETGEILSPETGWQYELRLRSHSDHFGLRYDLSLSKGEFRHDVEVTEVHRTLKEQSETEPAGWERKFSIVVRKGGKLVPWIRGAIPETLHPTARVAYSTETTERPAGVPSTAQPFSFQKFDPALLRNHYSLMLRYETSLRRIESSSNAAPAPPLLSGADRVTSVPGFRGERLPLPRSIMPTAMTFDNHGRLIFTSLKGHVFRVDGSGKESGDRRQETEGKPADGSFVPSPPSSGERARVRGPSGDNANDSRNKTTETPHPNTLPSTARDEGIREEKAKAPLTLALSPQSRGEGTELKPHEPPVKLTTLAEGLAAPFGVMWYPQTTSMNSQEHPQLLVAHKPELLILTPIREDDDAFNCRGVLATGWGITDDYHDWTCGVVRDSQGNLYTVLGSDYAFKTRPKEKSRWRGDALKISPQGEVTSFARGLRFPTGIALDDQDRLFVTDQQGVQNTFNELNHVQEGRRYGVPSRHEPEPNAPADPPAVQIPHPWTRSVNGVVFVKRREGRDESRESGQPKAVLVPSPPSSGERARVRGPNGNDASLPRTAEGRTPRPNPLPSKARGEGTKDASLALDSRLSTLDFLSGHFLAAEYNNNSIIRLSIQEVEGVVQGAVYPFSRPTSATEAPPSATPTSGGKPQPQDLSSFSGPMCLGISPAGDIYVGGFQDGGWAGGLNMGDIVKLTPEGDLPNGLREIRATPRGFDIEFFYPVDAELARQTSHYKISGYTRVWKGDYATPDSGRHPGDVTDVRLDESGRTVSLTVNGLKPGHVYDISVGEIGRSDQRTLWPAIGHYTLHRIPK